MKAGELIRAMEGYGKPGASYCTTFSDHATSSELRDAAMAQTGLFKAAIIESPKFDFGTMANADVMRLSALGGPLWNAGKLHLPFENVYFEHRVEYADGPIADSVYLAGQDEDGGVIAVEFLCPRKHDPYGGENAWRWTGVVVEIIRSPEPNRFSWRPIISFLKNTPQAERSAGRNVVEGVISLLAMLNLRGIMTRRIDHDPAKAARRAKDGKMPLFSHTVVKIGPLVQRDKKGRLTGVHASPRAHDRRGHIRQLPDGRTTWVRSCRVGSAHRGEVVHSYCVRP